MDNDTSDLEEEGGWYSFIAKVYIEQITKIFLWNINKNKKNNKKILEKLKKYDIINKK